MKKYLIILVLIIIAIAIGVYFFLYGKKDVCKNVIPKNAKAVLVLDAKQALKQMDFSINDIFKTLKQLNDEDKKEWGIDVLSPMYGFISNDNYVCVVFALSDANNFEKRISEENVSVESQRGFKWANNGEILLCFDSEKALAIGPVNKAESDGIRGKMVEWMNLGSHKVPVMSSLKNDGVLSFRSSLGVLPKEFTRLFSDNLKDVSLDDIFLNATLDVKEKAFLFSIELESQNEDFSKFMSEYDKLLRPIDAGELPYCIEEPLVRAVVNVEGEQILSKLRENPYVRTILLGLNLCVDTDMMIKAIDGDVLLEFAGRTVSSPALVASAKIKNKDFLKNAKDWCSGSSTFGYSCQAIDDKNFVLKNGSDKFFFGVRDEFLYLSSDNGQMLHFSTPQLEKNNSLVREQIQGKRLYASIDFEKMLSFMSFSGLNILSNKGASSMDHINISATDFRHIQYELTTKEKISDFIKGLLK